MEEGLYEFHKEGCHESYNMFGGHLVTEHEIQGVRFTVWAPHAKVVSVVGDFNEWDNEKNRMVKMTEQGIWSLFIPELEAYEIYKYAIKTSGDEIILKADPYATYAEVRPNTASVIFDIRGYEWNDKNWSRKRSESRFIKKQWQFMNCILVHGKRKKMARFIRIEKWQRSLFLM